MIVTWQTIITAGAVLTALTGFVVLFARLVRFVDREKAQDEAIKATREKHDADMRESREERQLLVYGILACLKGLKEQGCNGPVTEAINKIEKHLNEKAHE